MLPRVCKLHLRRKSSSKTRIWRWPESSTSSNHSPRRRRVRGRQATWRPTKRATRTTDRLARYEEQEACEVFAPAPGLVVYRSVSRNGGTTSRCGRHQGEPNELLFILPNTSNMAAELSVNEALSGYVKAGQQVTVVTDHSGHRSRKVKC